jgi:C-terminal processing protease CtpA/Prc
LFFACGRNSTANTTVNDSQENVLQNKKKSIVEKLRANNHLPVIDRIALYYQLKNDQFELYEFGNETELTLYGYGFLWENKTDDALAIFKLIVDEFPSSANAYDSLGEAYLQAKDSTKALQNYEKAFQMNPDNFYAEDVIQQIKYPSIQPISSVEKFSKVYSQNEYWNDLDQLGQKLINIHPHPFKFISKENFFKNIEAKKLLITENTTYAEFAWHCNAIIASIGCSHTTSSMMENDYPVFGIVPLKKTFPLRVRFIEGKLFVVDPMNNADQIKVKDEILSINGVETAKLIADIYVHIAAQANIQTYKRQKFNRYFALMIPYELGFPETFVVQLKRGNESITLKRPENFASELEDLSLNTCSDNLCFEIIDTNTAVLTIASFNYYDFNDQHLVFNAFLDKSFQELHQKKIKNLIIDVRYNGGGSQYPSIYLLQHLLDQSFIYYSKAEFEGKPQKSYGVEVFYPHKNRFKGNVFFLMDGNGNSTTGHFMSIVKVHNLGTIIGEELGSNQFCTAGQTLFRLKNTKFVVSSANNAHISSATALKDNQGILPDIYVSQSIDDYLNENDIVKKYTLQLINNNKRM